MGALCSSQAEEDFSDLNAGSSSNHGLKNRDKRGSSYMNNKNHHNQSHKEHKMNLQTELITDIACTGNPDEIVVCGTDKTVVRYNWNTDTITDVWKGHTKSVETIAVIPETGSVFSGSRDKTIKQWTFGSDACVQTFEGHELPVSALECSPDATRLCSGSRDYTLRFWDIESGTQIQKCHSSRNVITCLEWMDNNTVVQGSEQLFLRIWDTRMFEVALQLPVDKWFLMDCSVSRNGYNIASSHTGFGGSGCEVKLWDLRQNGVRGVVQTYTGHMEAVYCCSFVSSPSSSSSASSAGDKEYIVSCSKDQTVKTWAVDNDNNNYTNNNEFDSDALNGYLSSITPPGRQSEVRGLAVFNKSTTTGDSSPSSSSTVCLWTGNAVGSVHQWEMNMSTGALLCDAATSESMVM